jgi:type II secretory pathway pseudopilin PulG
MTIIVLSILFAAAVGVASMYRTKWLDAEQRVEWLENALIKAVDEDEQAQTDLSALWTDED